MHYGIYNLVILLLHKMVGIWNPIISIVIRIILWSHYIQYYQHFFHAYVH